MGAGTMVRFLGGIGRVESTPHVPGFFVRYGRFGTARRSRFESLVNKGFRYSTDFLPTLQPCNERHSFPSCRLCQHPFAFFFRSHFDSTAPCGNFFELDSNSISLRCRFKPHPHTRIFRDFRLVLYPHTVIYDLRIPPTPT